MALINDTVSNTLRTNLALQRERLLNDLDLCYTRYINELMDQKQRVAQSIVRQFDLQCNHVELVLASQINHVNFSSQQQQFAPTNPEPTDILLQTRLALPDLDMTTSTDQFVIKTESVQSGDNDVDIDHSVPDMPELEDPETETAQPNADWAPFATALQNMRRQDIDLLLFNRGVSRKSGHWRSVSRCSRPCPLNFLVLWRNTPWQH